MTDASDQMRASFRSMDEATPQDWQAIGSHFMPFAGALADRVLTHLRLLDGDYGGFPIDRLQHSLQTATRAHRAGEDEAYILKPFVSEKLHWMCQNHGIFQGYYFFHYLGMDRNMRDGLRGHEHFEDTARFCELYDQSAFDASYDTAPLDFFEPMVRRLFARPVNSIYVGVAESA